MGATGVGGTVSATGGEGNVSVKDTEESELETELAHLEGITPIGLATTAPIPVHAHNNGTVTLSVYTYDNVSTGFVIFKNKRVRKGEHIIIHGRDLQVGQPLNADPLDRKQAFKRDYVERKGQAKAKAKAMAKGQG